MSASGWGCDILGGNWRAVHFIEEAFPMLKGFRDFILRGNVMDLAVAVIIGAAFTAIVTALTTKIINPLLGAIIGKPNFDYLVGHVNGGVIEYGKFFTA